MDVETHAGRKNRETRQNVHQAPKLQGLSHPPTERCKKRCNKEIQCAILGVETAKTVIRNCRSEARRRHVNNAIPRHIGLAAGAICRLRRWTTVREMR